MALHSVLGLFSLTPQPSQTLSKLFISPALFCYGLNLPPGSGEIPDLMPGSSADFVSEEDYVPIGSDNSSPHEAIRLPSFVVRAMQVSRFIHSLSLHHSLFPARRESFRYRSDHTTGTARAVLSLIVSGVWRPRAAFKQAIAGPSA